MFVNSFNFILLLILSLPLSSAIHVSVLRSFFSPFPLFFLPSKHIQPCLPSSTPSQVTCMGGGGMFDPLYFFLPIKCVLFIKIRRTKPLYSRRVPNSQLSLCPSESLCMFHLPLATFRRNVDINLLSLVPPPFLQLHSAPRPPLVTH